MIDHRIIFETQISSCRKLEFVIEKRTDAVLIVEALQFCKYFTNRLPMRTFFLSWIYKKNITLFAIMLIFFHIMNQAGHFTYNIFRN